MGVHHPTIDIFSYIHAIDLIIQLLVFAPSFQSKEDDDYPVHTSSA